MSYGFRIIKNNEGIQIDPESVSAASLVNIPDGVFSIAGHTVPEGQTGVDTLGVMYGPDPKNPYASKGYLAASMSIGADRRPDVTTKAAESGATTA